MQVDVMVPANTTAELVLPYAQAEQVTAAGTPAAGAQIAEGVRIELGSGTYSYRYPLADAMLPDLPPDPPKRPGPA